MKKVIVLKLSLPEFLNEIGKLLDEKLSGKLNDKLGEQKYYTRKEVCNLLNISLPTLHIWTKQGLLKAYKIGNRVLYDRDEITQKVEGIWLEKFKKSTVTF